MIILSDCLTEKIDEGCLKVANSLSKNIKKMSEDTTIVSYGQKSECEDIHVKLNKLFLNRKLFKIIRKNKQPILYIPFASNTFASCVRTFVLSLFSNHNINVIFVIRFPMSRFSEKLLKLSKARIIALSEQSFEFYRKIVENRAFYLKTGIDTNKFIPVNEKEKLELRDKYKVPKDKKVVLHVGHLKSGRNVDKLAGISNEYHIVLVVSSVTQKEKDESIRELLEKKGNVTIIEDYIKDVQEVYQMSDTYVFPVTKMENCIDVPLSVLEAAACNLPIVTTEYGEISSFKNEKGFYFLNDLSEKRLNDALKTMLNRNECNNRRAVLEYDWRTSIEKLMKKINK